MAEQRMSPDQKGQASLTFSQVIEDTRQNFPESAYHPQVLRVTPYYKRSQIKPGRHGFWVGADGIGTKPELAERKMSEGVPGPYPRGLNYAPLESLAFDTFAMVTDDEYRFGNFPVGVAQIIDLSEADQQAATALATGARKACNDGRFALLNGETAELGYRVSGWGAVRLNWNAVATSICVEDKQIDGKDLAPGQPVVALHSPNIRSNGLSLARRILEKGYLDKVGFPDKEAFFVDQLYDHFNEEDGDYRFFDITFQNLPRYMDYLLGRKFMDEYLVPWHDEYPEVATELLQPSVLYGRAIYEAQGGIDGPRNLEIVATSHVTGGGVPEKGRRMVEEKGLGLELEQVFDIPQGIQMLRDIGSTDVRTAYNNWNMGFGYLLVMQDNHAALEMVDMAQQLGYNAAVAGRVIEEQAIKVGGLTWTY